jgi:hypothetical protein
VNGLINTQMYNSPGISIALIFITVPSVRPLQSLLRESICVRPSKSMRVYGSPLRISSAEDMRPCPQIAVNQVESESRQKVAECSRNHTLLFLCIEGSLFG